MGVAIDALLPIVRDKAARAADRRKAAFAVAVWLLPKKPKPKGVVYKDQYGFAVNPRISREYQDKDREVRRLKSSPARDTPIIKKKIERLEARIAMIRTSFLHCRSESYGKEQHDKDLKRLIELAEKEAHDGLPMTPEEEED